MFKLSMQAEVLANYLRDKPRPKYFKLKTRKIYNPVGLWWFFSHQVNLDLISQFGNNQNWASTDKGMFAAALKHRNQRFIVRCDIKKFFNNVRPEHVLKHFEDKYQEIIKVAFIDRCLPQGFCSSPILSDVALIEFDQQVLEYCKRHELVYTRFCDDIYISGKTGMWKAVAFVDKLLQQYKFKMSESKIKVMPVNTLHMVLGINVDQKQGWTPAQRRYLYQNYVEKNSQVKYLLGKGKYWKSKVKERV